ncbi:MAG: DUF3794 domain-containing protein [Ruminococcaceae bacterium]|nr:DUF3794 domain-containing protein [Oscillospiraceae bacterium]
MLDLIKDYVCINNLSLVQSQDSVYEFDCIIPDTLPDMQKILAVDAYTEIDSVSKTSGGSNVTFKINYKILYLCETEKKIKAFSAVSEHSAKISAPHSADEDTFQVLCRVANTQPTFINSRKISVKTTVHIEALQKSGAEVGICTGISGTDDIQTQKSSVTLSTIAESISSHFDIDEEIELSSGKASYKELLRTDAMLSDVSYTVIGDKLQIKGSLQICTLYVADDVSESLQIIENEIPFTHSLEVETIGDNISRHTDFSLNKYSVEALTDLDGEKRILHITATVNINADAYSLCEQEILSDAYSLSQKFRLSSDSVDGMLISEDISGQFVLRDSATKPDDLPEIFQIVNVSAVPGDYSFISENGKITVSGSIICNILYLTEDEEAPVASFSSSVPFVQSIDCPQSDCETQILAGVFVNHISFNIMSPSETEFRISAIIKGSSVKLCKFSNISEITQPENPFLEIGEDRPAILLYVVQPNDTLWKIAKKYNAPLDILKEVNALNNPDLIYPGQKLLIPR